jgi:FlaA1/EpsC-like NDP-sugar epimerase
VNWADQRVLLTGGSGSLGTALAPRLVAEGVRELAVTDLVDLDVTSLNALALRFREFRPTIVYHLAAHKSAPYGEEDPEGVLFVNALGTANVVKAAAMAGARVVTASTCKAVQAETVYGATKLIAERLTLNAGGWVARFYNVPESQGNVFEIWRGLPVDEPLPVTQCTRFYISAAQVIKLLLVVPTMPSGRYTAYPGPPVTVQELAQMQYPGRETTAMRRRRGDRAIEPRCAECETIVPTDYEGIERILNRHDEELK